MTIDVLPTVNPGGGGSGNGCGDGSGSGFSGRADIDYRPDSGPQRVMQGPAPAVWGNSSAEAMPFDALVRTVELRVEPQAMSHTEVDRRFADFTTGDLVVGTSAVVSTSVSIGIMIWVLRGGSLLTAFTSVTPVWPAFDPLPILVIRGP